MSEMSVEKKKEIEKYIIKSYFGCGKNVESLANGADVIKGTDDGYIPQLIVEVTYFGESGIVMIKWNIYGDSRQNSFTMRVCREREIERNRCDSVDSMVYAREAWKSRILNKHIFLETNDEDLQKDKCIEEPEKEVMERHIQELESQNVSLAKTNKDKNCIKFSMHSMMATHKPYQNYTDIAITGIIPGHEIFAADNQFDIPCDVVMVSKRYFDILQADNQHYRELAKQREENYNLLLQKTGFDTVENLIYYLNDIIQCDTMLEVVSSYISERDKAAEAFEKEINVYSRALKEWKEVTDCPSPSTAKSLLKHYCEENKKWQKATGCDSPDKTKYKINKLETQIKNLNDRLGGFIQAASCAEKHLEHVLIWKPEQTGQEVE